jgi:hypothetical protein
MGSLFSMEFVHHLCQEEMSLGQRVYMFSVQQTALFVKEGNQWELTNMSRNSVSLFA